MLHVVEKGPGFDRWHSGISQKVACEFCLHCVFSYRFTVGEFGACQMCARERSSFMFCVAINGFKALSFK